MAKRNRKYLFPQRRILVGSGNQNLATGDISGGTNSSLDIANGQLAVLGDDKRTAITAGQTITDHPTIFVVQGTENSANLSNVDPFGFTAPAMYESTRIEAARVTAVTTTLPEVGRYAVASLVINTAPTLDTSYQTTVTLRSRALSTLYDDTRDHRIVATVNTPATAVTDINDYVLQHTAAQLNDKSVWVDGNRLNPFIVFGVKAAGTGVAVSTIADGTAIPFYLKNGTTYTYTANKDFVLSLQAMVDAGSLATTDTIELIDTANAGTATTIEKLLVVGLDDADYHIFDNELARKADVIVGTNLEATIVKEVGFKEWNGTGAFYDLMWKQEVGTRLFFNNIYGNFDEVAVDKLPSPVDASALYTATTIEYVIADERTSGYNLHTHNLTILLPAQVDNPTSAVGAVTPPYTTSTVDTTTVADLNASLGAWLQSSHSVSPIKYGGSATAAAPFV